MLVLVVPHHHLPPPPYAQEEALPGSYGEQLQPFHHLLLVRALREDRVLPAAAKYIGRTLGRPGRRPPAQGQRGFGQLLLTTASEAVIYPQPPKQQCLCQPIFKPDGGSPFFRLIPTACPQGSISRGRTVFRWVSPPLDRRGGFGPPSDPSKTALRSLGF